MNQKSIKINFIYSVLLKLLNIVLPLITFPYIARVLSPEGIGKIDFSMSVIQYFVLIAQVGIPTYAIRECAKVRDSNAKLRKTVQEILSINLITIIVSYILFVLTIFNVEKLQSYRLLLLILSLNILSTSIGVEWFFQAIEEYRYITIRNVIVKIISLLLIFSLVRDENDVVIYALIILFSTSVGYFINFIYLNKRINIFNIEGQYNFKRHLKPILLLFAMTISVSVYINLDKVMIGFLSNDISVGLYSAANKMIKVIIGLVTSLGTVLLPRMSYYIENNQLEQVNILINKALNFILMISIPATIGLFMLAEPIILLFAGTQYTNAVLTTRIISPIVIAIALSNLIGIQILVSHGKEKITLVSTIIGAIINFDFNLLLIPALQHNGAAIGTLVAEISVTLFQFIFAYSYIKNNMRLKSIFIYCLGGILVIVNILVLNLMISNMILFTGLSVTSSILVYFAFLYISKDELTYEFAKIIVNRLRLKLKRS